MKRLLFALLLLPFLAHAGTATLTWTAPTTRTDGSPLSAVASYNVYRGTSATTLTKLATVTAPATGYVDSAAINGATNYYAVSAVDSAGNEGPQSNVASKAVPLAPPAAPTSLTIAAVTAYQAVPGANGDLVMSAVGTVAASTACDPLQGVIVGGVVYNEVPKSAVTFKNVVRSPDYARCA